MRDFHVFKLSNSRWHYWMAGRAKSASALRRVAVLLAGVPFNHIKVTPPGPIPLGTALEDPCPDCGGTMTLQQSRYGLMYGCTRWPYCRGSHGAHKQSGKPLGTPADARTRKLRMDAHDAFDRLWKRPHGTMKRNKAYRWLAWQMGLSQEQMHFGAFDAEQCRRAIGIVNTRLKDEQKTMREQSVQQSAGPQSE